MPERTPYIAANWKMNKTVAEAAEFVDALLPRIAATQCDVVVCPPVHGAQRGGRAPLRDRRQGRRPEHARGGVGRLHRRGLGADAGRARRRGGRPRPLRAPPVLRRDRRGAGPQGAGGARRRARADPLRRRERGGARRRRDRGSAGAPAAGRPGRGRVRRPGPRRRRLRADLGDRHRPHRDPRAGPGGLRLHPRRAAHARRRGRRGADPLRRLGQARQRRRAARPARRRRRPGRRRRASTPRTSRRSCEAAG